MACGPQKRTDVLQEQATICSTNLLKSGMQNGITSLSDKYS